MALNGAGDGNWGEGVCWCTEYGALTRRNVKKVSWRRLLELAMAAGGGNAFAHCGWSTDTSKHE